MAELNTFQKVSDLLTTIGKDVLVLTTSPLIGWFFGSEDTPVAVTLEEHMWSVVIFKEKVIIYTTANEKQRLVEEVLINYKDSVPFEVKTLEMSENTIRSAITQEIQNYRAIIDRPWSDTQTSLGNYFYQLIYPLSQKQISRIRTLGNVVCKVIENVARGIHPDMTENVIASMLAAGLWQDNILPTVILVGADQRAFDYRHPVPTDRKIEKYVLLAMVGRRYGVHICITRLVYFGEIPAELQKYHFTVASIDATMMHLTRPGVNNADILQNTRELYKKIGFENEFVKHHQGGPTGYVLTDIAATFANSSIKVAPTHIVSWNPTICGTKSEDTYLINDNGPEVVTASLEWPFISVPVSDGKNNIEIKRPDILKL